MKGFDWTMVNFLISKQGSKFFLVNALILACLFTMCNSALALPVTPPESEGFCIVTYNIDDCTAGMAAGKELHITLLGQTSKLSYERSIVLSNDTSSTFSIRVPSGDIYAVAPQFLDNSVQFKICTSDGNTIIPSFTASQTSYSLNLKILLLKSDSLSTPIIDENKGGLSDNILYKADYHIATGNAASDQVFNDYIDVARNMIGNSKYNYVLSRFSKQNVNYNLRAQRYIDCGGKRETWDAMCDFERFLVSITYVEPMRCSRLGDYDYYFRTEGTFLCNVSTEYDALQKMCNDERQAAALRTIVLWQYNYFKKSGSFLNFFTGTTKIGDTVYFKTEPVVNSAPNLSLSHEESMAEAANPKKEKGADTSEKIGIWGAVKEQLSVFSLIIITLAAGGLLLLRFRKKKHNPKKKT